MGIVSPEEFTTKHQTNVSAIHSSQLIVLVFVLVKAISLQGANIPLITASSIWNDVINPAEWFIISIIKIHVYSQGHIYVCAKLDILLIISTTLLLKKIYKKITKYP